jgi:hypothetical protein
MPYPPRHATTKADASGSGLRTVIEGREGDLARPQPVNADEQRRAGRPAAPCCVPTDGKWSLIRQTPK